MRAKTLLLIYYCLSMLCFAQNPEVKFSEVPSRNKISNTWVRSIYQDINGFIWTGTADGLNRYDGSEFKIYRPKNKYDQEIGQIQVNSILKKNETELWICTSGGIYIYNYLMDSLIHDPLLNTIFVSAAIRDYQENIWFTTEQGVYRLDQKTNDLRRFRHMENDSTSLSNNFASAIYEDSGHTIWIGTQNGLNRFDEKTDTFIRYTINSSNPSLGKNVLGIAEDHKKRIWVCTSQDGVFVMQNRNESSFVNVIKGFTTHLMIDSDQILWVTNSSGGGVDMLYLDQYEIGEPPKAVKIKNTPGNPQVLSDDSCFISYEDQNGDIWVGSYGSGINYYSKREKGFKKIQKRQNTKNSLQNNLVISIFEEEDYIWYGTDGGLDRYDKKRKKYKHFGYDPDDPKSLGANPVFCITKDKRDNLWVGTWGGGLCRYDYKTESFERFTSDNSESSISNPNVFSILEDKKNNLWIGTIGGGLNKYEYESNTFTHFRPDPSKPNSIVSDYVENIYEMSNGDIYLAAYYELQKFDPVTEKFDPYYFNREYDQDPKHIISLYEDSNQNIWIATNVGLYLFDEKRKTFTPYEEGQELKNKSIQAITEDNQGNLWLSSNQGLFEIIDGTSRPKKPVILQYQEFDGLSGNEFMKRAVFKNKSGKLYFGSSSGVTCFFPKEITVNNQIPEVVFTEFQLLYDGTGSSKKFKSTNTNINYLDELELSHKTSDFTIKYAALNYLHPEKNQYKYKLQGHNEDWIDAQGNQTVTYTNIPPGNYTFMVTGSNNDGVWNPEPRKLRITIYPPWWNTWVFKSSVAFFIGILIFIFYRIRFSFLKRQNQLLESKVKDRTNELSVKNRQLEENAARIMLQKNQLEAHQNHLEKLVDGRTKELKKAKIKAEESDRLKSSFLKNMSHEIRTPMNAIYGFSSLLDDPELNHKERSEYISIVKNNCDSLLLLIDNILDMSLIEANHTKLINEEFDLNKLLRELENQYKNENNKAITITFRNDAPNESYFIISDQTRFRQIFTNLLSNAIKFTASGNIDFGYTIKEDSIQFYVSDTGIGIHDSEIETIFDPFYKIVNTSKKSYNGTGIGLAICKRLVSQLQGKIWVNSRIDEGSTFYFSIPILTKEEIFVTEES